jgi:hypothetical protein
LFEFKFDIDFKWMFKTDKNTSLNPPTFRMPIGAFTVVPAAPQSPSPLSLSLFNNLMNFITLVILNNRHLSLLQ